MLYYNRIGDRINYLIEALEQDHSHLRLEQANRLGECDRKVEYVRAKQKEAFTHLSALKNKLDLQQDFVEVQNWVGLVSNQHR